MFKMKDGHVHLEANYNDYSQLKEMWNSLGIEGGLFISEGPGMPYKERIERVLKWKEQVKNSYAFFWIDPTEPDCEIQVEYAKSAGIDGIKAICDSYSPKDERAMKVWLQAASLNLPVLFHTGILIGPACSEYCRPLYYEELFKIPNFRFCLAHISWPWIDECIALCAKWRNCQLLGKTTSEFFIDTTPGTPANVREESLGRLYHSGFKMEENIIFGTDLRTNYKKDKVLKYRELDMQFFDENNMQTFADYYFYKNLDRFIQG